MSASYIRANVRAMQAYVPGEQPTAPGVVKLNTNENPYPPSPKVAEALRGFDPDRLRRYPDPLCRRLRERLAQWHGCRPEQILVANGSDEALMLCARAFVENDGSLGYFDPSYSLYPVLADAGGLEKRPVELAPDFTWRLPAGYAASLFFLTNPNAPTGMMHPRALVSEFCRGFPGVVVIDEAYVDFADESCAALALERENVLVARTLSKSYSLAGLRVGYALGPEPLIEALFKLKDSYNLDALAQELALAALADPDYLRDVTARVRATRARTAAALERLGFAVHPSQTNFLWVQPRGLGAAELYEGLKRRGIFIRYFPGRLTGSHVRITVGTDSDMDTLLGAVAGLLERKGAS